MIDVHLRPLPLLRRGLTGLVQVLVVEVDVPAATEVILTLAGPGYETRSTIHLAAGHSSCRIEAPAVAAPTPVRAELVGDGIQARTNLTLIPVRPWTVFVVHHTHVDLGYTDPQSRIEELHKQYIDQALRYCRLTADWPEPSRFRWNMEVTWPLKLWLHDRPASAWQELATWVRRGQVEITALGMNIHSETCAPEELARLLYDAATLRREMDIPVTSAIQSDVPGHTWLLPQLLTSAGIRYLAAAPNNHRAPFHAGRAGRLARPFWWEARDGSRVLVWFTDEPLQAYQEGNLLGFIDSYETTLERLPQKLADLETDGYPYAALHLRCQGAYADNAAPNLSVAEVARAWNAVWEWPRVIMARNTDFFTHIEQTYGWQIPTYRLDWPDWWADGIGAAAREVGLVRAARERLATAEGLYALLSTADPLQPYPRAQLDAAWTDLTLFDEHTFGAAIPTSHQLEGIHSGALQWQVKAGFAYSAAGQARRLEEAAVQALLATIHSSDDPILVVYNSLPWTCSAPVEVYAMDLRQWCPGADDVELVDLTTAQAIVTQIYRRDAPASNYHAVAYQDRLVFIAQDVPACGYRTYAIRPAAGTVTVPMEGIHAEGTVLETPELRVELDLSTGGLVSVYDKVVGRELVATGEALNRYIYQEYIPASADEPWVQTQPLKAERLAQDATIALIEAGPVMARAVMRSRPAGTTGLTTEVRLWQGLRRVDLENRLHKVRTEDKEGVYIAFPFAVPQFRTHVQIPGAVMEPREEQLPGSCPDWYCIQHFVNISGPDWGVTWAAVEAPLVQLGAITTPAPGVGGPVVAPTVYSYPVNNLWSTNFPAAQEGEIALHYAFAAHAGAYDPVAATRFGAEINRPLVAALGCGGQQGGRSTPSSALLEIAPATVSILALKQAEDGRGLIIHLLELAGQHTEATLSLPGMVLASALSTTIVEDDQEPLPVDGHSVWISLPPFTLRVVRLQGIVTRAG